MRTIALRLAYDGTGFVGSQWQTNGRSVQGVLETAWAQLTQEQQRIIFAGRTDAGVHAQGQVAHVRSSTRHPPETIQRALNALLPGDVSVLHVWDAEAGFHARYSAQWRKYRYMIDPAPVALPMLRHYVLHVSHMLDIAAMQAALALLPGEHDFAAFARVDKQERTTRRTCYQATCETIRWFDRSLIAVELVANGFLRHMVRTIVGTLLLVGQDRLTRDTFQQVLTSGERQQAGPTAPAHGLILMAVGYPATNMASEMHTVLNEDI
jgi:tRNA pseudouridine38-40 synthase